MTLCFQPDVLLQKTKEMSSCLIQLSHYHNDTIVWKCCTLLPWNRKVLVHNVMNSFPVFYLFLRKRAREEEIEAAEKAKREREWQKNFEVHFPSSGITSQNQNLIPNSLHLVFLNHLLGNTRWPRGQLEELPGQRQEEQGEKEQNLPEAPQSKDGAAGIMLWARTEFTITVTQKQALCIFTSASAGSFVVHFTHHQDTHHTANVLVPTLANVVLYSVFLMYIFVIHSQRSYLPRVRIEKNVSSTSVTDEKCG